MSTQAPDRDRATAMLTERDLSWRNPRRLAGGLGKTGLSRFTGFLLWGLFILAFSILTPDTFLSRTTLTSIISAQSIAALLTLAVLFPLAAGAFDLSVGQNLGTSALLCGYLMFDGPKISPPIAIAIAIAFSTAFGLINGYLVAVVGIDSFIATLGTGSILLAIAEQIAAGRFFGPFPGSFTNMTSAAPLGVPVIAFYLLGFALVAWYALEHTPMGRRIYATGANQEAARLAGVRTRRMTIGCFAACGFGAGVTGVLLASTTNSVSQSLGPQYLLPAYAASFLGTTQIKLGRFNVWGAMLSIFLLGTGVVGLQLSGLGDLYVTDYFNGVALIVAVGGVALLQKNRGNRAKRRQIKTLEKAAPPPAG